MTYDDVSWLAFALAAWSACAALLVATIWDYRGEKAPSWWLRVPRVLPEWGPSFAIALTSFLPLVTIVSLDSWLGIAPPDAALGPAIFLPIVATVFPMLTMALFSRPKFLIPPRWRNAKRPSN